MKPKQEVKSETVGVRMTPSLRKELEKEALRRVSTVSALASKLVSDGIKTLREERI